MLTPHDIHLLVGLLTQVASPENVEIELGSMVYDQAGKKQRDVDITVTYSDAEGERCALKGIEVNARERPLGIEKVEQLCLKLKDMPDITHRSIVSASGYSDGAKLKAKSHGVELLHLKPWVDLTKGFEHAPLGGGIHILERGLKWVGNTSLQFIPSEKIPTELKNQIESSLADTLLIYDPLGNNVAGCKTVGELKKQALAIALLSLSKSPDTKEVPAGKTWSGTADLEMIPGTYIQLPVTKFYFRCIKVEGEVEWVERHPDFEFKILVRDGENQPLAGCAIGEAGGGHLMGLSFSQSDTAIRFLNIPITERNRKKIQNIKLKKNADVT